MLIQYGHKSNATKQATQTSLFQIFPRPNLRDSSVISSLPKY